MRQHFCTPLLSIILLLYVLRFYEPCGFTMGSRPCSAWGASGAIAVNKTVHTSNTYYSYFTTKLPYFEIQIFTLSIKKDLHNSGPPNLLFHFRIISNFQGWCFYHSCETPLKIEPDIESYACMLHLLAFCS